MKDNICETKQDFDSKCMVCGTMISHWDSQTGKWKGEKPIVIESSFHIKTDKGKIKEIELHACPVCKTVTLNENV